MSHTDKRKYRNIKVSSEINVSSTGHFTARVMWTGGARWYALDDGFLSNSPNMHDWNSAPKYLIDETKRQIANMIKDGTAKFFEYDRDKNRRYENLRYYDPEHAQWVADGFLKDISA